MLYFILTRKISKYFLKYFNLTMYKRNSLCSINNEEKLTPIKKKAECI